MAIEDKQDSEGTLDRRAAMEQAWDKLSGSATDTTTTTDSATVAQSTSSSGGKDETVVKVEAGNKAVSEERAPSPDKDKVVSGQLQKDAATDGAAKGEEKPVKGFKAPAAWKPEIRAHWDKVPEPVRAEVLRREAEVTRTLNHTASARKLAEDFAATIRPYESLIRVSGVSPLQAVNNLMSTAAALQQGTPAQKANVIARIISQYGIDIPTLDSILAGKQAPAAKTDELVMKAIDQRLAPVTQFINTLQQTRQSSEQQLQAEVQQEAETFATAPENEYFEDLREDIADILETSARRGRAMSLREAYDRAAQLHPDISKLIKQKSEAEAAAARAAELSKKRAAASSTSPGIPGSVSGGKGKPANRREAISMAFDALNGG